MGTRTSDVGVGGRNSGMRGGHDSYGRRDPHALHGAVWSDLQRGVPDGEITRRLGISKSELSVITADLEFDGQIAGHVRCPRCGYLSGREFDECPKCGVVVAKWAGRVNDNRGVLARTWACLRAGFETVWDTFNCGGYRVCRAIEKRIAGR